MDKKYISIIAGLLIVLLLGVYLPRPTTQITKEIVKEIQQLGAASGSDHYNPERFWAGFGGAVLATSTNVTAGYTFTEKELQTYSMFEISPLKGSVTWTLPATSTLATLLKNEGDTQTWIFRNATTSTGINFTLAAGTGWDLTGVDANVDVIAGAATSSQVFMMAQCVREAKNALAFNIMCALSKNIAAD